ncbi:membrane dipeptidase [Povalibacter uvarum]|uniref:Membrane dipeptidase n=1 Tax=Povalibacter uvarum TaxID=732238 RepID=A0A841HRH2_9GAMM|nr:dipeptidase [Povalibacter uvarum]MBB6095244.1 membrane dipeptidase [Povalibacter uvarum]
MKTTNRLALASTLLLSLMAASSQAADKADPALAHARELLKKVILIDGHNDLPWAIRNDKQAPGNVEAYDLRSKVPGQTDLARLREGGVGGQFWSVYTPGEAPGHYARTQLEQIDIATRMIQHYPDAFRVALTAADVRSAHKNKRIASMMGIEGGHAIENSLGALRTYYDLGVRYMTLTHNVHTDWADSAALPAKHGGLTPFGEQVVHEMNRLGMLVDLSHVAVETMDDALRVSKAPVIFSHSSARALCNVPRNVPDDILKRLGANGGVVMVTFVAGFIDPAVAAVQMPAMEEYRRRAQGKSLEEQQRIEDEVMGKLKMPVTSIAKVADHIEYVRKVAGVEHVGIGGDFDGNSDWPEGLSDVSMYPNLFAELIRRGWSDRDLTLLAGENVLRAMEKAEAVARSMKSEPAPPGLGN